MRAIVVGMVCATACGDNAPPPVRTIVSGDATMSITELGFTDDDAPIALENYSVLDRVVGSSWSPLPGTGVQPQPWLDLGTESGGALLALRGDFGRGESEIFAVSSNGLGAQVGPAIAVELTYHPYGSPSGAHYVRIDGTHGLVLHPGSSTWAPTPFTFKFPIVPSDNAQLAMTSSGLVAISADREGYDQVTLLLGCDVMPGGDCAPVTLAGRDAAGRVYLTPGNNTALLVVEPNATTWRPLFLPDGYRVQRAVVGRDAIVVVANLPLQPSGTIPSGWTLWWARIGDDAFTSLDAPHDLTDAFVVADHAGHIYVVGSDGWLATVTF